MKWLVPPWCAQLRPMGGLDTLSQLEGRGNRTSSMGNCTRATPTRSGNCTRATNIQFGQPYQGNQIPPCWATVPRYISKLTAIPGQQARSVTPTNSSDLGNRTGVFYHTVRATCPISNTDQIPSILFNLGNCTKATRSFQVGHNTRATKSCYYCFLFKMKIEDLMKLVSQMSYISLCVKWTANLMLQ